MHMSLLCIESQSIAHIRQSCFAGTGALSWDRFSATHGILNDICQFEQFLISTNSIQTQTVILGVCCIYGVYKAQSKYCPDLPLVYLVLLKSIWTHISRLMAAGCKRITINAFIRASDKPFFPPWQLSVAMNRYWLPSINYVTAVIMPGCGNIVRITGIAGLRWIRLTKN